MHFGQISSDKLHRSYFLNENVVEVAEDLIGRVLATNIGGTITKGIIVETEAYCGRNDKACHANNGRRTARTEVMYQIGGVAYIYLCYGIHHLFNVVTNHKELADAVLIRAIHPTEGLDTIKSRFKSSRKFYGKGPGVLTRALGIHSQQTGLDLTEDSIWIEKGLTNKSDLNIVQTTRIGVGYAQEDALLPWRFYLKGDPNVSQTETIR